jgi:hypothetical protein
VWRAKAAGILMRAEPAETVVSRKNSNKMSVKLTEIKGVSQNAWENIRLLNVAETVQADNNTVLTMILWHV